MKNSDKEL